LKTLIEHLEFILTVDRDDTVLRDAALVMRDDRIIDLGPSAEVLKRHGRESFDRIGDG